MKTLVLLFAFLSSSAFANPITEGQFKLYSDPGFKPNPGCDRHVSIVLDNANLLGEIAVVENGLAGFCEIYVHPETKLFRLTEGEPSCGSRMFDGEFNGANGQRLSIKIQDNRSRICRDLQPAQVIVTIQDDNAGDKQVLYSQFR